MEGMTRRVLALALVLVSACHHKKKTYYAADGSCSDPAGCQPAPVYPNEYKVPDEEHPGDTGVEITQASCDDVAHALASMDLGNWATEEALAPVIAKHRATCVKQKLTQDERQCIFESTDTTGLAYCAPRLVPGAEVAVVAAKDCAPLTTNMRQQMAAYASQPVVAKQMDAVEESCAKDRWPTAFGECVRSVPYPGYISAYCAGAAPAPLRKKIENRLASAK